MIRDLFLMVMNMLIVEPFQADIQSRLAANHAPAMVMQAVENCAREAGPKLAQRAADDPWWGVGLAFDVALGRTTPQDVISEGGASCASALALLRPLMT